MPVQCGEPGDVNPVPLKCPLCTHDGMLTGGDVFVILVGQALEELLKAAYFSQCIISLSTSKVCLKIRESREIPGFTVVRG